jgi:hypothetical protein
VRRGCEKCCGQLDVGGEEAHGCPSA